MTSYNYKFVAFLIFALLMGCSNPPASTTLQGETMGTYFQVKIISDAKVDSADLYQKIIASLDKVNAQMSTYIQDSQISRFNQSVDNEWFEVDDGFFQVTQAAKDIYQQSKGAFDPTIAPLINLWSFGEAGQPLKIPSDEKLKTAMANIGMSALLLQNSPPALKKDNIHLKLNLSAIAKGYGVDMISKVLDKEGFVNYLVDIGGELKAKGKNIRGQFWSVAVEKPESGQLGQVQQILSLENTSIATSGSYRNYFEQDGQRFSHIINPKTGRPITHKLVSVSVLHDSNMYADAYATMLMVLGDKEGYEFALQNSLPVYMIVKEADDFIVRYTPYLEPYLRD